MVKLPDSPGFMVGLDDVSEKVKPIGAPRVVVGDETCVVIVVTLERTVTGIVMDCLSVAATPVMVIVYVPMFGVDANVSDDENVGAATPYDGERSTIKPVTWQMRLIVCVVVDDTVTVVMSEPTGLVSRICDEAGLAVNVNVPCPLLMVMIACRAANEAPCPSRRRAVKSGTG